MLPSTVCAYTLTKSVRRTASCARDNPSVGATNDRASNVAAAVFHDAKLDGSR